VFAHPLVSLSLFLPLKPDNGRSSPIDEPSPPPKSPESRGGLQPPPGLGVSAIDHSLNDLEIPGDVPLQRRREVRFASFRRLRVLESLSISC
jgi:hypothetical protein